MPGAGDHERPALANDLLGLAQDRLDLPRIALVAGELPGFVRRLELVERDQPALDLRDGLLRDDDHVAGAQLRSLADHRGEVVAGPDLRQAAHRDQLDHSAVVGTPVTRTPACAL